MHGSVVTVKTSSKSSSSYYEMRQKPTNSLIIFKWCKRFMTGKDGWSATNGFLHFVLANAPEQARIRIHSAMAFIMQTVHDAACPVLVSQRCIRLLLWLLILC